MRKKSTLLILFIAFLFSCIAQPQWQNAKENKFPEKQFGKFDKKKTKNLFYRDITIDSLMTPRLHTHLTKKDWYEPDTIYIFHVDPDFVSRYIYTFQNGLHSSTRSQVFSSGQWVNSAKSIFTYNKNKKILEELYQSWSSNKWVNSYKRACSYNAMDSLTETFIING